MSSLSAQPVIDETPVASFSFVAAATFLGPAIFALIWISAWGFIASPRPFFGSVAGLILTLVTAVSTYTDFRWRLIPNWATYPGALWGVGINAAASVSYPAGDYPQWLGAIGLANSLVGFGGLFLLFLIVFSFTGGGAGDIKLAAVIGSLVGLEAGLTVMMIAFIAAGIVMTVWIVWTKGPAVIATTVCRQLGSRIFPTWINPPSTDAVQVILQQIPLAPFFAVGVVVACASSLLPDGTFDILM